MDARLPPASHLEPTVDRASEGGWRRWAEDVARAGRARLAALGLLLVLGLAAGAGALFVFAMLADEVLERDTERLDFGVLELLRSVSSPTLDSLAFVLSLLGSEAVAVALVVLVGYFAFRRRWGAAISLVVVTVGAQLLNNVLKDLFHRTRPAPVTGLIPAQAFSFPSGHAMVSAAFYLFLAYAAWRILHGWLRVAAVAVLLLLVALIGLSRLYLGVHFFTDVVAGYLAGFVWTDSVILGGWLLSHRRRARAAPAG